MSDADYDSYDQEDYMSDGSYNEGDTSDQEEDLDMDFSIEKPRQPYEVDFRVLSVEEIHERQVHEAEQARGILNISTAQAATLLRYFRWNKDQLIDRFMSAPNDVLTQAGIITDISKAPHIEKAPPQFCCDICCQDDPDTETLALHCNHRFCVDCYRRYLKQKINYEGESVRIQCPAGGCKVVVDEHTVENLVPPETNEKYRLLLTRTYVDDNDHLRWCPAPNCEYAIDCPVSASSLATIVPTVKCLCGHSFCHGCSRDDHQPCICSLVKHWTQKCKDDSETSNWIQANTKECSKCNSTIEKNGGCNHMTCRKCHYEFCWVCMGPWSEHGTNWYNCNRFDEKSSKDARDSQANSRQQLERYLHYYNRYANHDQSARLDQKLHRDTERKMEEVQQRSDLSWIEVQFLRDAVDKLVKCRMTLKWTYAFAYYLARDNQTELFENNQRDLEIAVEQLSELLERGIDPANINEVKQTVLDKSMYVSGRREVLLSDTANGLTENRWQYTVDI